MLRIWLNTLLTSGGLAIVGFFTSMLTARALGPEGRGLLASVMLIVTLATGVSQFGLGQAFVYMRRSNPDWKTNVFFFGSAFFVSFTAILITAAGLIFYRKFDASLVTPTLFLSGGLSLNGFTVNVSQIESNLTWYNLFRLIVPLGLFVGTLLFYLVTELDVHLIISLHSTSAWLVVLIAFVSLSRLLAKTPTQKCTVNNNYKNFLQYINLGLKYHGTTILGLILNNIDKVYLFLAGGLAQFGLYSVAFGLSRLLGTVQDTISTALFSRFAGNSGTQLTSATLRAFRITFWPMMCIATGLSLIAKPTFSVVFGSSFEAAAAPFALLLFESVISGSGWILAQQFNAQGKPGFVLFRQLVALLPLLLALPWISNDELAISLAVLLLVASLIRLIVTIMIYRWIRLEIPSFLPTCDDIALITNMLKPTKQLLK